MLPIEDVGRYRAALAACVRLQDPAAYRGFVLEWRDLIQRGAVERLVAKSDGELRERLARMALDDASLSDVHEAARETLADLGIVVADAAPLVGTRLGRAPGTVRLRRPGR